MSSTKPSPSACTAWATAPRRASARVLLDSGTIDLIRVTPEDEQAVWALFCERPDQRYSFTDRTSFALVRRLGLPAALALDDDFRTEGFRVVP